MIARENLDGRQRRLLHLLTALFERQPFLDTTSAAEVYTRLRVDLIAAGATDSDFECLTEHLIGLVIEHGSLGLLEEGDDFFGAGYLFHSGDPKMLWLDRKSTRLNSSH